MMNYIVLDLEWNQPFDLRRMKRKPFFLHGEIIQIGAVKTDENFHMLDTFKIMVTPKYYTKMNKRVSRITRITNEDLQYGFPFPSALKYFRKWCGEDFAFFTWGSDDLQMFRENMMLHKMDTSWLPDTYNLQIIFDDQISKENRQISLEDAMEKIGEEALIAHDALNDARNTVRICQYLDIKRGILRYNELQMNSYNLGNDSLEKKEFLRVYESKEAAWSDPELTDFFCPLCREKVFCSDFVAQNSNKSICIGQCENGDEFLVRIKFKKRINGNYGVSRIIYKMSDENRQYYNNKKQRAEEAKAIYLQKTAETTESNPDYIEKTDF